MFPGDTEVDFSSQGGSARVSGVVRSSQFSQAAATTKQAPAGEQAAGQADSDNSAAKQSLRDQASLWEVSRVQASQEGGANLAIMFRSLKTGESYETLISAEGKFSFANSTLPPGPY